MCKFNTLGNKNMLDKFKSFELKTEEQKEIVGGQVAYCTDGSNATCYQSRAEANNRCFDDNTCGQVTKVTF